MAPLDFSSPSLDAVEYAIQVAIHFGAKMTLGPCPRTNLL